MVNKVLGTGLACAGVLATAGAIEIAYFYGRTMKRQRAEMERTVKMAGTDWSQYKDMLAIRKKFMLEQPHEDVYIESFDYLRLHGVYFPAINNTYEGKRVVICLHGYTSRSLQDFTGLTDYYFRHGYAMLQVDARGIVSDCAFTSPKEVFSHVLKTMYHLPTFPVIPGADVVNRIFAGYGMDECNAKREVEKATVPILFIHGDKDTFVPTRMCKEIYECCASPKKLLIVEGAAHGESYYKDTEAYEAALDDFLDNV